MKFIHGQEEYLINNDIKRIVASSKVEPVFFNQDDLLEDILVELQTISMFSDSKLIIIKNHPILTDTKLGKVFKEEMNNVSHDSLEIIFSLEEEKVNKSNELIKFLFEKAEVVEHNKIESKDVIQLIKDIVNEKGGYISNSGAMRLSQKLPNNLRLIVMEIEKLLMQDLNISDEMIDVSVAEQGEDDFFALPNAVASNNKHAIVKSYNDKIRNGEQPTVIISQISAILNLSALVASYRRQGLTNQDISDITKIHVFRIKKANDLLNYSSVDNINNLLIELGELDKNIKTGVVDDQQGLDAFILKLLR